MPDAVARRRTAGQDTFDEVHDEEYVVAPIARSGAVQGMVTSAALRALEVRAVAEGLWSCGAFNLGDAQDFRVPRAGWFTEPLTATYAPSAAVVLEVTAPDNAPDVWLPFYAAHGVQDVLLADPTTKTVTCRALNNGQYIPTARCAVMGIDMADLEHALRWP